MVFDHVTSPGFLEDVVRKGDHAASELRRLGRETGEVTDVRGLGLLVGFDLTGPERADHVIAYARDHGVLLIKAAAATIRLVPALNINDSELDTGLEVIGAALRA